MTVYYMFILNICNAVGFFTDQLSNEMYKNYVRGQDLLCGIHEISVSLRVISAPYPENKVSNVFIDLKKREDVCIV